MDDPGRPGAGRPRGAGAAAARRPAPLHAAAGRRAVRDGAGAHPAAVAGARLPRRRRRRPRLHRRRRRGAGRALDADRLRVRRPGDRGLDRPGDGPVAVPAGRLADRHARRRPDPRPRGRSAGRPRRTTPSRPRARCCRGCARCRTTSGAGTSRPTPTGCSPRPGRATAGSSRSGFADLVGYTSRSRGMGGRELGAMVEDFESIAAEVIARHHGRVVKTVGDGVLFTAAERRRRRRDRPGSCPRPGTPRTGRRCGSGAAYGGCSPGSATSTRRWSTWPAG